MPDKGRLYGIKTGFGDGKKGRSPTSYVVQGGDTYSALAAQFTGDPRAYGDFLRANNYKPLKPGMTINIPTARRKDYFVSSADVSFANRSNPNGSQMQQSWDYVENYKAARAAGFAGVNQAQAAGMSQSGIAPKPVPAAVPLPTGENPVRPVGNTGQNYSQLAAGGPAAFQATQQANANQAAIAKGAALEGGNGRGALPGAVAAGTPTPIAENPTAAPKQNFGITGASAMGVGGQVPVAGQNKPVATQSTLGPQGQIAAAQGVPGATSGTVQGPPATPASTAAANLAQSEDVKFQTGFAVSSQLDAIAGGGAGPSSFAVSDIDYMGTVQGLTTEQKNTLMNKLGYSLSPLSGRYEKVGAEAQSYGASQDTPYKYVQSPRPAGWSDEVPYNYDKNSWSSQPRDRGGSSVAPDPGMASMDFSRNIGQ